MHIETVMEEKTVTFSFDGQEHKVANNSCPLRPAALEWRAFSSHLSERRLVLAQPNDRSLRFFRPPLLSHRRAESAPDWKVAVSTRRHCWM